MKKLGVLILFFLVLTSCVYAGDSFAKKYLPNFLRSPDIEQVYSFEKPYFILDNSSINVSEPIELQASNLFYTPHLGGLDLLSEPGYPKIPYKTVKLILPYGESLEEIKVIPSNKKFLGNYNLDYGETIVPYTIDESNFTLVEKNLSVYNSDAEYPDFLRSDYSIQKMDGYSILVFNLYPLRYIPKTGEVFYYEEIQVEIFTSSFSRVLASSEKFSKDFARVRSIVDNPQKLSDYPRMSALSEISSEENYDYVIVTNKEFNNSQAEYNFQDLISWKQGKGLSAKIFLIEDIVNNSQYDCNGVYGDGCLRSEFNDSAAHLRNFVKDMHQNHETRYLLLGGDADRGNVGGESGDYIVPVRVFYPGVTGYDNAIASDVYYSNLDGNFNYDNDSRFGEMNDGINGGKVDLYSEVFVGRAPIDSDIELSNFVRKTIWYENYTLHQPENYSDVDIFFKKSLMVGEHLGFGKEAEYGDNSKEEVRNGRIADPTSNISNYTTVGFPKQVYVDKLYDSLREGCDDHTFPKPDYSPCWSDYDMINKINSGYHIINHLGHGSTNIVMKLAHNIAEDCSPYSALNYSRVNLFNNTQYFFAYSQACFPGSFDNWNYNGCYSKTDSIAEHFVVDEYGAFAVIMNSRYGWGRSDSTDGASQRYDRQFFDAVYGEGKPRLSEANVDSKEDNIGAIIGTHASFHDPKLMLFVYYELNLLGDPEVSIYSPPNFDYNLKIANVLTNKEFFDIREDNIFSVIIENNGNFDENGVYVEFLVNNLRYNETTVFIPKNSTKEINFSYYSERGGKINFSFNLFKQEDQFIYDNSFNISVNVKSIKFTNKYTDHGFDSDGNGLYDQIVIGAEVDSITEGFYDFQGMLYFNGSFIIKEFIPGINYSFFNGTVVGYGTGKNYITEGLNNIEISFPVYNMRIYNISGNLSLSNFYTYDSATALTIFAGIENTFIYNTSKYNYNQTEILPISLTQRNYDFAVDIDNDGKKEYIVFNTEVNITKIGTFGMNHNILYNKSTIYPRSTSNRFFNDKGIHNISFIIDSRLLKNKNFSSQLNITSFIIYDQSSYYQYPLTQLNPFVSSVVNISDLDSDGGQLNNQFTDEPIDLDSDGKYDFLKIRIGVNISKAGIYSVQGRLYSITGGNNLGSARNIKYMTPGDNQFMDIYFDGRTINIAGSFTSKLKFSDLTFSQNSINILSLANPFNTTSTYRASSFSGVTYNISTIYITDINLPLFIEGHKGFDYNLTLANIGNKDSGRFNISIYDDNNLLKKIVIENIPNSSVIYAFDNLVLSPGVRKLSFIFDLENALGDYEDLRSFIYPLQVEGQLNSILLITNCEELQNITDLDANYLLTNNVECDDSKNWNSGKGFKPIGNLTNPFIGTLNGQGFNITNLKMYRPSESYLGLFGYSTGEIKNLNLINLNITGNLSVTAQRVYYVGGISAVSYSNIINCSVQGSIDMRYSGTVVGALTGENYGNILYSYSNIKMRSQTGTGGISGYNYGNISRTWANVSILGSDEQGGISGSNFGIINECFSTGKVESHDYDSTGGLVGQNRNSGVINNSYSHANAIGARLIGGLSGMHDGVIINSYSNGSVSLYGGQSGETGGLTSSNTGECENSFWDIQTSGMSTSYCGIGKTTSEMKQQSTFTGWDFVNVWRINQDYPYLAWENSTIVIDTISPFISFVSPLNQTYNINQIIVNITNSGAQNVWWNNGTENLSYSAPINLILDNDAYKFIAYANDSYGNLNYTSVNFNVNYLAPDVTKPYFTYIANISIYTNESVAIDFNANDNVNISCFSVNDTINFNINCSGFLSNKTKLDGLYRLNISINDTSNNVNSSVIYVNVSNVSDSILPYFSKIPAAMILIYVDRFSADFDAVDNILFSSYTVNDTRFSINNSGLLSDNRILAAGIYYLNVSINDSSNNRNSTIYSFTINKASSVSNLTVFPLSPIFYETYSNFSCSNNYLSSILYVNNVNKNSDKSKLILRSAGEYVINCTSVDNQNYTGDNKQISYVINKSTPNLSISILPSEIINNGTPSNVTGLGCNQVSCKLYQNGVNVSNSDIKFLEPGIYEYIFNTSGNTNYTFYSVNVTLTVNNLCYDSDHDGYNSSILCGVEDCDDGNANINPAANESCNNLDDNCNREIDEDLVRVCGSGVCSGSSICTFGLWGNCSSNRNDAGICSMCNSSGGIIYDSQQNDCNDNNICNGIETCKAIGQCNLGVNLECSDGLYCNGLEYCDSILGCRNSSNINCNSFNIPEIRECNHVPDNNEFTLDVSPFFLSSCNETSDACNIGAISLNHTCDIDCNAECENDLDCSCSADRCYDADSDGNNDDYIDYSNSVCDNCSCSSCTSVTSLNNNTYCSTCSSDVQCDDGIFCNGQERCVYGFCSRGNTVNCSSFSLIEINSCSDSSDDNPFTRDLRERFISTCNESSNSCEVKSDIISHSCDLSCGAECIDDSVNCPSDRCIDYDNEGIFDDYADYELYGTCDSCRNNISSCAVQVSRDDLRCPVNVTFNIVSGQNFIGNPFNKSFNVEEIIGNNMNKVNFLMTYDNSWKIYIPFKVNSFINLSSGRGCIINAKDSFNIELQGYINSLSLIPGWNLVSGFNKNNNYSNNIFEIQNNRFVRKNMTDRLEIGKAYWIFNNASSSVLLPSPPL